MLLTESETKAYLDYIRDWKDPYPKPVLEEHQGITVVRDDLLHAGTKVRAIDYLIGHDPKYQHVEEWVLGSCPAQGYAQISLPSVCNKYGKKAVLFVAKRNINNLHPYQKRGIDLGAKYNWVENGMLAVTQKRARDYVAEKPNTRMMLPMGLEHPAVFGSFIKVARDLFPGRNPDYVWSAGSSGTLNRSLQMAYPNAEVHVVSCGHKMSEREIGRAIYHRCEYKFEKETPHSERPPFPSALAYDAKVWKPLQEWRLTNNINSSKMILLWNVGG